MKCPNCGKEIANDSLYCEFCGTKVLTQDNQLNKTVTVLGYTECFLLRPSVSVFLEEREIAIVEPSKKIELNISKPCVLNFKCRWRTTKCMVKPGDWVLLSFNRFWGTLSATITDKENYQFAMNKAKGDDARNWIWTIIFIAILAALAFYLNK